jgi:hypothetical protein
MKQNPKIIFLKGNGPVTINNEMMELFTITTSHGLIGLPLKSLHAHKVYILNDLEQFWEIHKIIKEKPACFLYSYEGLNDMDLLNITAEKIIVV